MNTLKYYEHPWFEWLAVIAAAALTLGAYNWRDEIAAHIIFGRFTVIVALIVLGAATLLFAYIALETSWRSWVKREPFLTLDKERIVFYDDKKNAYIRIGLITITDFIIKDNLKLEVTSNDLENPVTINTTSLSTNALSLAKEVCRRVTQAGGKCFDEPLEFYPVAEEKPRLTVGRVLAHIACLGVMAFLGLGLIGILFSEAEKEPLTIAVIAAMLGAVGWLYYATLLKSSDKAAKPDLTVFHNSFVTYYNSSTVVGNFKDVKEITLDSKKQLIKIKFQRQKGERTPKVYTFALADHITTLPIEEIYQAIKQRYDRFAEEQNQEKQEPAETSLPETASNLPKQPQSEE